MLTVYKASAGSGKTFRLVLEYLKLVLVKPSNYRQILAVTFTNKATAEMKERILDQLGRLSGGLDTSYLDKLQEETGLSEIQLRSKARSALESLLFDYDHFSVSTIDRFTQRILKAFNREIGVNPNYLVEADSDLLISEAVDRMVASMDSHSPLLSWLESFVEEKIRNNQSFAVENDLKSLGKELFRESLQSRLSNLTRFFSEKENNRDYLKMLHAIIRCFENNLKKQAGEIVDIYTSEGFTLDDFSYGNGGIAGFLEKMAKGSWIEKTGPRVTGCAASSASWAARKHPRYAEIICLAEEKLMPRLVRLLDYIENESRNFFTARAIVSEWFTTAVLVDLNQEISTLGREKGILPLAGSNLLLKSIIDGTDTPFIYEKAGNTWRFYMLDEFQDTSEMQWDNFKPLIGNSLSVGLDNLVVGDVKQSIYRWRNSNWNILDHQIHRDFPGSVSEITLHSNYRSGKKIVEFNNGFFRLFSDQIAGYPKLQPIPDLSRQVKEIYGDIVQQADAVTGSDGFVCIERLEDEDNDFFNLSLARLAEQVRFLLDKGYKAGDIAILVRKKDQGARIVRYFLDIASMPENRSYQLKVLSGESLFLKSSPAVNFLISLYRWFTDRENRLAKAEMLHLYKNYIEPAFSRMPEAGSPPKTPGGWILGEDWEQDFETFLGSALEAIGKKGSTSGMDELIIHACSVFRLFDVPSELPYLQALVDQAAMIRKNGINDISGFLQWWDETGKEVPVNINEEVDAIRLLTIHKAKGLEFRAVLIPFLSWNMFENTRKNILWCTPDVVPFNKAPLVPVGYSDKLAKTIFDGEYFRELANLLIDNLNLVYVAFTRAISVLWVNVPAVNKTDEIGSFVNMAVQKLTGQPGFEDSGRESGMVFSYGTLPITAGKVEARENELPGRWIFHDFTDRLTLRRSSEDFLQLAETGTSQKNSGKTIHSILAWIRIASDVEQACRKALATGVLLPEEEGAVVRQLTRMVTHPEAKEWFSDDWKVYMETDLLSGDLTLRPDRMMIRGDRAVVVDYKTGGTKQESHIRQVRRYARILRESGFREVKGYLWYIGKNELVKV